MTNNKKTPSQLLYEELAIDLDEVSFEQLANYVAVEYFLTVEDDPSSDATNLEKVNRYLESFHHLCKVEDWERASKITFFRLNQFDSSKEIHNYLFDWGYLQEVVNICQPLIGKLNQEKEAILLSSISHAYEQLGRYQKVIKLQNQLLKISHQLINLDLQAEAFINLGNAYQSLGQYQTAINYYEEVMEIASEIQSIQMLAISLVNIANAKFFLQKYEEALQLYQQYLNLGRKLNNKEKGSGALLGIANCYRENSEYQKAITYYENSLVIAKYLGYRRLEASILGNLGVTYKNISKYNQAIEYHQRSLSLEREMGNIQGEATALGNLGVVYRQLREYQTAINYQKQTLTICKEIDDRHGNGRALINLGNIYQEINDINQAFLNWIKGIFIFHDLKIKLTVKQLLNNYFPSLVSIISQFSKDEQVDEEIEIITSSKIYIEEIAGTVNLDINKLNTNLKCNAIEEIVKITIYYFRE